MTTEMAIRFTHMKDDNTGVNAVNARHLWENLGVEKDFSDWIKAQIKRARLVEERDYFMELVPQKGEQTGRGGHNRRDYFLTIDAAKHIAMIAGTEKGFEVREYFIEVEKKFKAVAPPQTREEILASAFLVSQQIIAEKDNQIAHLEKTKSWISEKREKTAMTTASKAVKKSIALEEKLGESVKWKKAMAIPWIEDYFNVKIAGTWKSIGQQLRNLSIDMGKPIKRVESSLYPKGLNAYHKDVISGFKHALDEDQNWMCRYRK